MKKKSDLESEMKRTELRLERASKLMSGLADERVRWSAEVERLTRTRDNVVGDALLAAGGISYLGPFTSDFRRRLFDDWISRYRSCFSFTFSLSLFFSFFCLFIA